MTPTQQELHERFTYDPKEPFALRWGAAPWGKRFAVGSVAGYWHATSGTSKISQRYIDFRRNGQRYRYPTHLAVWIYHCGSLPERAVLFKNGDSGDCRISNLAERADNKTGKEYTLWNIHRLTFDEYARMLETQNGVCAICKKPETGIRAVPHRKAERHKPDSLAVDHCHETGHFRGLLCHKCNRGLGLFNDNPDLLKRATTYIEKYKEEHQELPPKPPRKVRRKQRPEDKPGSFAGVTKRGNRWRAKITVDYKQHQLGTFATAEEARSAYIAAAAELGHHSAAHRSSPSATGG